MNNCAYCKHAGDSAKCALKHPQYWDADLCVTVPLATEMGRNCKDYMDISRK